MASPHGMLCDVLISGFLGIITELSPSFHHCHHWFLVAGVAAMLLQLYPQLNAYEARDAILHPDSYDSLVSGDTTQYKAEKSTTGGRLNFYKTLTNVGFLSNPVLNNDPIVTVEPNVVSLIAGESAVFDTSVNDPDGDT